MAVSLSSTQAAAAPGGDGPSVTAGLLGLHDPQLDDLKEAAISIIQQGRGRSKRAKMTHSLFFDDERGLKKVVQSFPKIRFAGKGREFDDLKLLIRHYERWFKDLYPCDDNFEDLVWKARSLLQEKEKADDGVISDPKERLHLLRFEYKRSSGMGTKGEKAKLEAAAAQRKTGGAEISEELRNRIEANRDLDVETLWKIEEKRAKALEIKLKRQAETAAKGGTSQTQSSRGSQEDVFGFGGAVDRSQSSAATQGANVALAKAASQGSRGSQDDVFGFGFGLDGSQASAGTQRAKQASQHSKTSQDDVFGFGAGLDGSQASSARSQTNAALAPGGGPAGELSDLIATAGVPQPRVELSEELRQKIEANRQRALEVQKRKREAELAEKGPEKPSEDLDIETLFKIEENRAKAMELRRKRQARAASQASQTQSSRGSQEDVFGFGGRLDTSQSQASGATQRSLLSHIAPARGMSQSQSSKASQAEVWPSPASQHSMPNGGVVFSQPSQAEGLRVSQADAFATHAQTQAAHDSGMAPSEEPNMEPDIFGFSFDFDASQAAQPSAPANIGGPVNRTSIPPPSNVPDPFMAMSQPDVFGFGFGLDASQVTPAAPSVAPRPASTATESTESSAPEPFMAMSQPDVFGFGFGLDASQAEPTARVAASASVVAQGASVAMPPPSFVPVPKSQRDVSGRVSVSTPAVATPPEAFVGISQPDVFGFGFDLDATQAAPTDLLSGSLQAIGASQGTASMLPPPVPDVFMAMSQPDMFGLGFGLDATQAMRVDPPFASPRADMAGQSSSSKAAPVDPPSAIGQVAVQGSAPMPPPPVSDAFMVMSQPDVFGFGFGLDASQVAPAPPSSAPRFTSVRGPGGGISMSPPAAAPEALMAMSQPDVFGFGFDFDASQA